MFTLPPRREPAVTLLELMTVMLVIAILAVLLIPVTQQIRRRLEKTRCIANLIALHAGMDSYVQDKHGWPQIPVAYKTDQAVLAQTWIDTLKPYGLAQKNWICPTTDYNMGSPDLGLQDNRRIDYTPFPYGRNQQDPFRYANQPWFIENGDMHGNGNLMIFSDGHTEELVDYLRRMKQH